MVLERLELHNFRSYRQYKTNLHPHLNLVIGPNGSGKTNLLEALYVLARAKSFRASDEELIYHGEDWFRLLATSTKQEWQVSYQLHPAKQKKIKLGKKTVKLENYIGKLSVVLFEPTDLNIITGAPADRRRWLDAVLAGLDGRYFKTLVQYRRVLKQRNTLLRSEPKNLANQLFAWDVKLAELGQYLFAKRQQLIKYFAEHVAEQYQSISQHKISINTMYATRFSDKTANYGAWLLDSLNRHMKRDQILGSTSDGPHRDDILIEFAGKPIQSLASRGEVRTMVLVYKILELKYIEEHTKTQPLLLLDDVFSELDARRRDFLLAQLAPYQSIITATDLHGLKKIADSDHAIIRLGETDVRRRKEPSR